MSLRAEAPGALTATPIGKTTLRLRWRGHTQTCAGDPEAGRLVFELQVNEVGSFGVTCATRTLYQGALETYSFTETNGRANTYAFRVRARYGESEWSLWSEVLVTGIDKLTPARPGKAEMMESGWDYITFKWTAPNELGAAVIGYVIYADGIVIGEVPASVLEFTWFGVPAPTGGSFKKFAIVIAAQGFESEGLNSEVTYMHAQTPEAPRWTPPARAPPKASPKAKPAAPKKEPDPVAKASLEAIEVVGSEPEAAVAEKIGLNFRQNSAGYTWVQVAWDPPVTRGCVVEKYIIENLTLGKTHSLEDPEQAYFKDESLTEGTEYIYTLKALSNMGGMGEGGPEPAHTNPATPPDLPPNFKLVNARWCKMTVSWGEPCCNGADITAYIVRMKTKDNRGNDRWEVIKTLQADARQLDITRGIVASKNYEFAVCAVNYKGEGRQAVQTFKSGPAEKPAKMKPVTLVSCGYHELCVKWVQPEGNGDAAGAYTLRFKPQESKEWKVLFQRRNMQRLQHQVPDLLPEHPYCFEIAAHNCSGMSELSDVATFSTVTPGAPEGLSAPTLHSSSQTSLHVVWKPPDTLNGAPITGYDLRYRADDNSSAAWENLLYRELAESYELTGLDVEASYTFELVAHNAKGGSPPACACFSTDEALVPAKMDAPQSSDILWHKMKLCWTTPDGRGRPVEAFTLWWRDQGGQWEMALDRASHNTLEYELASLSASTSYGFKIQAHNVKGTGEESDLYEVRTAKPDPPSGMSPPEMVSRDYETLGVCWTPPKQTNGGAVIGYKLFMDERKVYGGPATSFTMEGLKEGTTYTWTVLAYNAGGDSARSQPAELRTKPADVPGTPVVELVAADLKNIEVCWGLPACNGSPVTHYKLRYCMFTTEEEGTWQEATIRVPIQSHKFEGLDFGHEVQMQICAINGVGLSAWSEMTTYQTLGATVPAQMAPPEVRAASDKCIWLQWKPPRTFGCDVTGYKLFRMDRPDQTRSFLADELQCAVENLQPDTTYSFKICATSDEGDSLISDIGTGTTEMDGSIPWADIMRVLAAMETNIMVGHVQEQGCKALWGIAQQQKAYAMAVSKVGGFTGILRAMWAYPDSRGVQNAGCGAVACLGQYAPELEVLVDPAIQHIMHGMQTAPWRKRIQGQARYFVDLVYEQHQLNGAPGAQRPLKVPASFNLAMNPDVAKLSAYTLHNRFSAVN